MVRFTNDAADPRFKPLIGDGHRAKSVLAEIGNGSLKGTKADNALREARYNDWREQKRGEGRP